MNLYAYCTAALIALALSCSYMLDGPSELEAIEATEASLRDALEQAQRERPDMWTPETRANASAAVRIAARGAKP